MVQGLVGEEPPTKADAVVAEVRCGCGIGSACCAVLCCGWGGASPAAPLHCAATCCTERAAQGFLSCRLPPPRAC